MNELQIFNNQEFGCVRLIEIGGKHYAVGNDIAKSLEYARPYEAVSAHCKGAVSYRVLTNGGEQDVKIIPEGDIYRLIVKAADQSKNAAIREKAERFEHWIFDEILPSIRKTGTYSINQVKLTPHPRYRSRMISTAVKDVEATAKQLMNLFAAKDGIAYAAALNMVQSAYGVDMSPVKPMLPAATHETGFLNAGGVGKQLGVDARKANRLLVEAGLQVSIDNQWRLTEAGKKYAEEKPYNRNGHSGWQIKWNESVVDVLDDGIK